MPAQVQQKLRKARQFLLASNFAQALPCYQKLSQLCSTDAVIWFEYGSAAAGLRNRELADRAWHKSDRTGSAKRRIDHSDWPSIPGSTRAGQGSFLLCSGRE